MNISHTFINKITLPKRIISKVLFYFPLITTQTCATTSREVQPSLLSTSHHLTSHQLTSRLLNNSAHRYISLQRSGPVWQVERGTLHGLHIANTWLLKPRSHHWYIWPKNFRFVDICGYFPRRAKHVPLKICFAWKLNSINIKRHGHLRVITTPLPSLITWKCTLLQSARRGRC